MPKGPRGEKRPADVVSNAVKVARMLVGDEAPDDTGPARKKDAAAQSLGRKGGQARAASLSAAKRSEIAKKASAKRWGRKKK